MNFALNMDLDLLKMIEQSVSWVLITTALVAQSWWTRTAKDTYVNLVIFFVARFGLSAIAFAFQFFFLNLFSRIGSSQIVDSIESLVFCVLWVDFLYYWQHRLGHEVRLLWITHAVHHSSEEYNLTTALRLPWFSFILNWIFLVPAVLLGFSPLLVLVSYELVLLYQFWLHTERIGSLGILEWILNTPQSHQVHHAKNLEYLDKNYGGIFIIWDRIFNTYQRKVSPPVYGVLTGSEETNAISINLSEFRRTRALLGNLKGFREILIALLGNKANVAKN